MGNEEHYKQAKQNALLAAETIERFKGRLPIAARRQIETRTSRLTELISAL